MSLVNQAVIRADSQQLLSALLLPSCGVDEVLPANVCRYMRLLSRARQHKAQVRGRKPPRIRLTAPTPLLKNGWSCLRRAETQEPSCGWLISRKE